MIDRPWCYFGCGSQAGHYLFPERSSRTLGYGCPLFEYLTRLDGDLAPKFDRTPYRAVYSWLGAVGYAALSWWDYTVDKRPGSNSTIFAPAGVEMISAFDVLEQGQKRFPWVFGRLPEPLQIIVVPEPPPSAFH